LAPERLILQGRGLTAAVINTIQSARAPSTSYLIRRSGVLSLSGAETLALPLLCVRWGTCLAWLSPQLRSMRRPFRLALSGVFPFVKRHLRGARHVNMSFECSRHVGTFPPCVGYLRPPLSPCVRLLWMLCLLKRRFYWPWCLPSAPVS